MKIVRDEKSATFTLVPVEKSEKSILAAIIKILKPGDKIFYGGRDDDENGFFTLDFYAGARKKKKTEKTKGFTCISTVYVGGIKLTLCGSTKDDKKEIKQIRSSCYVSAGEFIFISETEVDGKKAIIVTIRRCKLCRAKMITLTSCEWGICDACAAKCRHNYINNITHGGFFGKFCGICGRGKTE
jgi:hypothetical protein